MHFEWGIYSGTWGQQVSLIGCGTLAKVPQSALERDQVRWGFPIASGGHLTAGRRAAQLPEPDKRNDVHRTENFNSQPHVQNSGEEEYQTLSMGGRSITKS
jgi:hypothetical protein